MVVDRLAEKWGGAFRKSKWKGEATRVRIPTPVEAFDVVLGKPATFMNLSGDFVAPLLSWHKIELSDLLVIHDDMDLPLGKLRLVRGGGSGGHKGLESIFQHLGTGEFPRLKIGVGHPDGAADVVNYVLSRFAPGEEELFHRVLDTTREACECWVEEGLSAAMNRFNGSSLPLSIHS